MKLFTMIFLSLFLGKSCEGQTKNDLKTAVLEYTNSLIAPIIVHFLWNSVGAIILGGVSLAEDYPHLFNMTFGGNQLLSGGIYKIEGSVVVFVLNVIMIIGFIMAKKKKNIA